MSTRSVGQLGEELAVKYLKRSGYTVLDRNSHQSYNELDIVAANRDYIIFVEVKTRSVFANDMYSAFGTPASAVTKSKQMRTVAAAKKYLSVNAGSRHSGKQPRMDVIEVYLDKDNGKLLKLNHITDAFGA